MDTAKRLLEQYPGKIVLPTDTLAGDGFSNDANTKVFPTNDIPDDWEGMDIGPESIKAFSSALEGAKTVFWNGPMGVFEFEKFSSGTNAIAKTVADLQGAYTVIGGGDSVSAIHQSGQADKISHISTGGGASLELLEGKILPGVAALG
jgi:phosphoglycerate kinase